MIEQPLHSILSPREFQILCMMATGRRVSDISRTLGISVKTGSTYRIRMFEKMKFGTIVDLITYAIRHKLVE